MIGFLTIGIILGLSAGMAPGPLLTLVISETFRHGFLVGTKVAIAPVITDLPIILAAMFLLSSATNYQMFLGIISIAGGVLVFCMGLGNLRIKSVKPVPLAHRRDRALIKGILTNALSPHPYLFWFTAGGATLNKAMDLNLKTAICFLAGFYGFLIGSKMLLAYLTGKSSSILTGTRYLLTIRFLGVVLCGLSLFLFYDGFRLIGVSFFRA